MTLCSPEEIDWIHVRARVRRRIAFRLGSCDAATLDDLTQEALVQLVRLSRSEPLRNPDAAATMVANRVVVDEIRRRRRRRQRLVDWEPVHTNAARAPVASDDDPELRWFVLLELLRTRHPAGHALAQAYAEHGDWQSVARALGRGHDAVRQQWARCVLRCREAVRRDPDLQELMVGRV